MESSVKDNRRFLRRTGNDWLLVERYVEKYPHEWRIVFRRGDDILDIQVPEEVWRAFDIHQIARNRQRG